MTVVLELVAVVLLLAMSLLLKRNKPAVMQWVSRINKTPRQIRVVDQVRLTPTHSIHIVRFQDSTMVLAVHPGGCQLLAQGEQRSDPEPLRTQTAGGGA